MTDLLHISKRFITNRTFKKVSIQCESESDVLNYQILQMIDHKLNMKTYLQGSGVLGAYAAASSLR